MLLCVPNSAFSCASCDVHSVRSVCLLCDVHYVRSVYVSVRAVYRYDVCVLYLFSCAIIPVRCVWLVPVCPCVLCIPVSCAVILRSVCLLCGVHSVRCMYPCVLSTMCACSISFRVLLFLVLCEAYSCMFLCYIPCIPAVSCDVFPTLCLSPLWIYF